MKDYYDILGISPDATQDEIKEQYRFLLHAWHPDKFPNPQQKSKAEERTKELNEAYNILSDSVMRIRYDRERYRNNEQRTEEDENKRRQQEQTEAEERRAAYERQQRKNEEAEREHPQQTKAAGQRAEINNEKTKSFPWIYIVIGIVIILLIQFFFSNNQNQSPQTFQVKNPTENPYKDCITWQETEYHDGETVCIIGKIIFINKSYDDLSGQTIWGARFSMADNTFRVVSVRDSLDEWQDKCVVIRGTLRDRSKQEPEFRNGPWMINSENSTDYSIREAPVGLCQ